MFFKPDKKESATNATHYINDDSALNNNNIDGAYAHDVNVLS